MMKNFLKSPKFKNTKITEFDEPVQNGLAITPRQMAEMMAQGIPIAPQNLGLVYEEGVGHLDFDVSMDRMRGIDRNDMWEEHQEVRKNTKKLAQVIKEKGE